MNCKELEHDLALAAADLLEEERMALVLRHVRACPECAAVLKQHQAVGSACRCAAAEVQQLPLRLSRSPEDWISPAARRDRPSLVRLWRWLLPLGAGAALALVFLLARRPVPEPLPPQHAVPAAHQAARRASASPANLAAYRRAFGEAGDDSLDSLLDRDANLLLPRVSGEEVRSMRDELF
jgi:hypothetical protein